MTVKKGTMILSQVGTEKLQVRWALISSTVQGLSLAPSHVISLPAPGGNVPSI